MIPLKTSRLMTSTVALHTPPDPNSTVGEFRACPRRQGPVERFARELLSLDATPICLPTHTFYQTLGTLRLGVFRGGPTSEAKGFRSLYHAPVTRISGYQQRPLPVSAWARTVYPYDSFLCDALPICMHRPHVHATGDMTYLLLKAAESSHSLPFHGPPVCSVVTP